MVTADMSKLLEGYYRTEQEMAKLKASEQKAQEELERMVKEGNQMAEQYKETLELTKKPVLTDEAVKKAESDAAKMLEESRSDRLTSTTSAATPSACSPSSGTTSAVS